MKVGELVRGYYGADDKLSATILGVLASAGIHVDELQHSDLALVDHLHAGGAQRRDTCSSGSVSDQGSGCWTSVAALAARRGWLP